MSIDEPFEDWGKICPEKKFAKSRLIKDESFLLGVDEKTHNEKKMISAFTHVFK